VWCKIIGWTIFIVAILALLSPIVGVILIDRFNKKGDGK